MSETRRPDCLSEQEAVSASPAHLCLSAEQGFRFLPRFAQHGFTPSLRSAQQGCTSPSRSAQQGFTPSLRSAQQGFTSLSRSAQQGFTSLSRSAQQGFTLLEMLVALAVFSLAALALVRLQAVSVRTTADLDTQQMARIVAHNEMVDLLTSQDMLSVGNQEGDVQNGGRSWHWRRQISKTDAPDIVRVDLSVTGGITTSPVILSFLRVQPQ